LWHTCCGKELESEAAPAVADTPNTEAGVSERVAPAHQNACKHKEIESKIHRLVAWERREDSDKLAQALREADEAEYCSKEVEKARELLKKWSATYCHSANSRGLLDFLRAAKPQWAKKDVESAHCKLVKIGIDTKSALMEALSQDDLNSRLRHQGQKMFSEETLKGFRREQAQSSRFET